LSVYLKAGHLDGDLFYDIFYHLPTKSSKILHGKRVKTVNTHGTGCSLSSAIAAFWAKHDDINVAVEKAQQYIQKAIFEGKDYKIGNGHGPINHFFEILNK
jgi:hydroxymethylpyrimidine/phosphomethylpyrimidine kinase